MKKRIAINGFGRIGRVFTRLISSNKDYELVAINDIASPEVLAHLFKYDSIHGVFKGKVSFEKNSLIINNLKVPVFRINDKNNFPWGDLNVDCLIESSGKRLTYEKASEHLKSGAKQVILTAPPKSENIKMVVMGVNHRILNGSEEIISNASCTTNCAAPMIKILNDFCGIEKAYVTTVHSYTGDQKLHDSPHSDLRRARSAPSSIIPTTTGAAKALSLIFPSINIGGCGIRVPVSNGSLIDITCVTKKSVSCSEINDFFKFNSKSNLKGILSYTSDPIVSVDIISNNYSCIFDSQLTYSFDNLVKIVGWYDNEYGYSSRLIDLIDFLFKRSKN
tara:strand:+ start:287 stop:1288 length:1002 start_codon:yes stop_codon:yes gene_type:complete